MRVLFLLIHIVCCEAMCHVRYLVSVAGIDMWVMYDNTQYKSVRGLAPCNPNREVLSCQSVHPTVLKLQLLSLITPDCSCLMSLLSVRITCREIQPSCSFQRRFFCVCAGPYGEQSSKFSVITMETKQLPLLNFSLGASPEMH